MLVKYFIRKFNMLTEGYKHLMFSSNKCSADQSLGVMVLIGMIRKDDFQKRLPGIHIRGTGQGRAIRPYSL